MASAHIDLAGGQTASGNGAFDVPLQNTVRLPNWTAIEKDGAEANHWIRDDGRVMYAGDVCEAGRTYTAVWYQMSKYDTEYFPCPVLILETADSAVIDISALAGLTVKAHVAENRGGETTFTLRPLSSKAEDNPLSPSFSGWSDGQARAMTTAMYCWVGDVGSDGYRRRLSDGFISSIVCREDGGCDVTVADWISVMSRQGTALRRNIRSTSRNTARIPLPTSSAWDGDTGRDTVTADVGTDALGGLIFDPNRPVRWWARRPEESVEIGGESMHRNFSYTRAVPAGDGERVLCLGIGIVFNKKLGNANWSGYIDVRSGSDVKTVRYHASGSTSDGDKYQRVEIWLTDSDPRGLPADGLTFTIRDIGGGGTGYAGQYLRSDLDVIRARASELTSPASGGTVTSPSKGDSVAWVERCEVFAYSQDSMLCSDSMAWCAEALGYMPDVASGGSGGAFAVYRAGGTTAQGIISALADIPNASTGRMLAWEAHGRIPVVSVRPRTMISDGPSATVAYAGDGIDGAVPLVSHRPSRTLAQRPNAVTVRGSISAGSGSKRAVTLSVRDPASTSARGGLIIEQAVQSSSMASVRDGMVSAWSALRSKALDTWEGEAVIAWDARRWLGTVIRIADSRYGIDEVVRVSEVLYDYGACTVTLRYGNVDSRYSSSESDAAAAASSAGSTADGSGDYNQQSVSLVIQHAYHAGDVVQVNFAGGVGWKICDETTVYALPGGGHIYVGIVGADSASVPADVHYGVIEAAVDGRTAGGTWSSVTIPEALRPDHYKGQTLTVCIQTDG